MLGSHRIRLRVAGAKLVLVLGHSRCRRRSARRSTFSASRRTAMEATNCEHLDSIVGEDPAVDPPRRTVAARRTVDQGGAGAGRRRRRAGQHPPDDDPHPDRAGSCTSSLPRTRSPSSAAGSPQHPDRQGEILRGAGAPRQRCGGSFTGRSNGIDSRICYTPVGKDRSTAG